MMPHCLNIQATERPEPGTGWSPELSERAKSCVGTKVEDGKELLLEEVLNNH